MGNGYWGRVLDVDLSSQATQVRDVGIAVWQRCIGGAGYAAHVLLEEVPANVDPFSSENLLVFASGPYQAGRAPGNAKWTVASVSPLTGTYGDSAAGAKWGPALKRSGYDALIVRGTSPRRVILVINEDRVSLEDAGDIWSADTYETTRRLTERLGAACSIVSIGPAGERRVRFACLVVDGHSFAGRCGIGAVMGAKGLKAIVVSGTKAVGVSDAAAADRLSKLRYGEILEASRNGLRMHGTPDLCITAERLGDMPIKNWAMDAWPEGAAALGAPNYTQKLKARPFPCVNCPIGCHRLVEIEGADGTSRLIGPEYETLGMLGTNLLIDDLAAVVRANDVCNRAGLDTISAGAAIALAMESVERGWLSDAEVGFPLRWGDGRALIRLVEMIAAREGVGDLLAEGAIRAARMIHPDAEEAVAHVKGLEYPAHDPRTCWSLALNYATCTRGACHMRGVTEDVEMMGLVIPELGIDRTYTEFFSSKNKAELTIRLQDLGAWMNSAVVCAFMVDGGGLRVESLLELFNSITGWDWDIAALMTSGERVFTLQRLVNVRDGHGRATDTLPPRMQLAARQGFRAGRPAIPFEPLLTDYYEQRGWNASGVPTRPTLERLGLLSTGMGHAEDEPPD